MKKNIVNYLIIFIFINVCGYSISAEAIPKNHANDLNLEVVYPDRQYRQHRPKDNVRILKDENRAIVDISSSFGIGNVNIISEDGSWPEIITVHLHLQGLEGFSVTNGKVTLRESLVVDTLDENGNLLEQKYLLDRSGFYEVKLPSSLFIEGTRKITISWVDFYRQ